MNVVKTIVPGNPDAIVQAGRQTKDNASQRGESGFSDTLGSFGKVASSREKPPASMSSGEADTSLQGTPAPADASTKSTDVEQKTIATPPAAPLRLVPVSQAQPVTEAPPAVTVPVSIEVIAKGNDVAPAPATQPVFDMTGKSEPLPMLTDLAMLVSALNKLRSSATAHADAKGDEPVEVDAEPAVDAEPVVDDNAGGTMDLMALLAATTTPVEQPNAQPVSQTQQGANQVSEPASAMMPVDGTAPVREPSAPTVVRLQKDNTPAVDFHVESGEDGKATVDVTAATGDVSDVMQVVESRRFVGLAAPTNATAITSAMAADPDWAMTMAGQTTNAPMIASTGQVVHVLKIQMAPVELGHVTAALKLVGDELSVQLTAHTLKGYSELQKDSSGILEALKSQGFSVEQVTVTLATNTERQDSNTNGNRQPQDTGQQGAQQGQRGQDERSQEKFNRPSGPTIREEVISHEPTSKPEAPVRSSASRPGHVYL